jgi:peptidoglycan biosynthesis protein MviN/MurJ (putative lipid II flippase)
MLLLMLPLLLGIVFAKVRDFYNHITVLSYLEEGGLIKANKYGVKLFQAVSMIIPYALSIAMFPFFCDLVAKRDQTKLGEILTRSSRMLLSVFVPMSLACVVYAPVLVQLLVAGKFSEQDASLSGLSMAIYTLVLPAYSVEMLLMQAFFAERRMVSVTVLGILFSAFSIVFSYVGIIHFGATGAVALSIVAVGYVLSRNFKTVALIVLLRRNVPLFPGLETLAFLFKTVFSGVLAAAAVKTAFAACALAFPSLPTMPEKIRILLALAAAGTAGAAAFLLCACLLRIREPAEMLTWAMRKVRNRAAPPPKAS